MTGNCLAFASNFLSETLELKEMRLPDTTHKKQSKHVKIVPAMGAYLPKKSMTASFLFPRGPL